MSEFKKCNCNWCTHTRYKVLSYVRCINLQCNSIGYFNRISRIYVSKDKLRYECGFLCNFCFNVIPSRTSEEKNLKYQLSLEMCRCALCSFYRNVYEITQYCKICNKYRKLIRMKRIDKSVSKIISRCGFLCENCGFFHIEVEKQYERIKGQVNCFGL